MPKVVEVPGVGNVEFPDSMTDEQVGQAIRRMAPSMRPPSGMGDALTQRRQMLNTQAPAGERFAHGLWDELPNLTQVLGGIQRMTSRPLDTLADMSEAQWDMLRKADKAIEQGDYLRGIRHAIEFALPVIGPQMSRLGDTAERGDVSRALGGATTLGVTSALPNPALRGRTLVQGLRNPNKVVAGAYDYLAGKGVNIPAGTRVGNKQAMVAEQAAAQTFGGSRVARAAQAQNAQALTRIAQELADEAHPQPATPYSTGEDITRTLQANSDAIAAGLAQDADDLGGRIHPQPIVPLQAGANLKEAAEGRVIHLSEQADTAYEPFHKAARDPRNRKPVVVGYEGTPGDPAGRKPITEEMDMPVFIGNLQKSLRPLVKEWEMLVEPARRNTSRGYTAAKSIVEYGKPYMEAELAEKSLGGLKDLVRTGPYEDAGSFGYAKAMRDTNQSVAGIAVEQLQKQIDDTVRAADPAAVAGLESGRRFTARKFDVADNVVGKLLKEPVQAYGQMVYAGDSGINFVNRIAEELPEQLPQIGRAFFGELSQQATNPAGWSAAKRRWDKLGDQTKQKLIGDPATRADIDAFFNQGLEFSQTDIMRQVSGEPVVVYNKLTGPEDSRIEFLKRVEDVSPAELPKVGRAFLTELIDKATREGGWTRNEGLLRDWQRLGDQTKAKLYPNPLLRENIEKFFQGQKSMAERVNKSETAMTGVSLKEGAMWGTAGTMGVGLAATGNVMGAMGATGAAILASLSGHQLAKLLYSPRGTELLMRGIRTPTGAGVYTAPLAAEITKFLNEDRQQERPR